MLNRRLRRLWVPINLAIYTLSAPKIFDLCKFCHGAAFDPKSGHATLGRRYSTARDCCAAVSSVGRLLTRAVLLAVGLYRTSDRETPLPIDHTIGIPTNGMWPISWTNQRILIAGGRCKRSGMTASDITIQMKGPYSDATLTTPYGELSNLRIHCARLANNRNTTDHPKATPKCIRTPIANVKAPPLNASGPSSVLATPRKRRCTVE